VFIEQHAKFNHLLWKENLDIFELSFTQLNAFTVSAQCEYDMRCKVLGHEQQDVLELCLMLLADGLCSMPGAVVIIHPNGSAQINGKIKSFWRI
jgi:hypothetical protein